MSKIFENNFFKNIPLSTFKGLPKENVQEWLSELDEYFEAVNATSAQKVIAARLLMKDNARRWLKLCPATPAATDPWEHFKSCVRARFLSANHKDFARTRLLELKQRGSVTKYIADFQDLCSQIDDISEAEALANFKHGLKPNLQAHFSGNPTLAVDLSTVMQIAESLDKTQYKFRNFFPAQWPHNTLESPTHPESFPQPMELDATYGNRYTKQQQLDLKNRTCFQCHAPGHQSRDCPKNKNPKSEKAESH